MIANRISLVTVTAGDVRALAAFYARLGWVASHETDKVAFFDMAGMKFGIYGRADLARDIDRAAGTLGTGAMTLSQNFADKAAVDAAFAAAIAAGATVCKPPEDIFWGGYTGSWADPEGHVWEYAWNPFWELDDAGHLK